MPTEIQFSDNYLMGNIILKKTPNNLTSYTENFK